MNLRNFLFLVCCYAPISIISQELIAETSVDDITIMYGELESTYKSDYSKKREINKATNKKNKENYFLKKGEKLKKKELLKNRVLSDKTQKLALINKKKELKSITKREKDLANKKFIETKKEISSKKLNNKISFKKRLANNRAEQNTLKKELKLDKIQVKRTKTLAKQLKIKQEKAKRKEEQLTTKILRRKAIQLNVKHISLKKLEAKKALFIAKRDLFQLRKKKIQLQKKSALSTRIAFKQEKKKLQKTELTKGLEKNKLFNGSVTRVEKH